jgi:hypothetical protein
MLTLRPVAGFHAAPKKHAINMLTSPCTSISRLKVTTHHHSSSANHHLYATSRWLKESVRHAAAATKARPLFWPYMVMGYGKITYV